MKVRITTPSRLHFCLVDLNGSLGRVDGGVGVALKHPSVVVECVPSEKLEIYGERKWESEEVAKRVIKYFNARNVSIKILKTIPQHVGLGSTTQLYLGIARAISELNGIKVSAYELAKVVRRGGTSGIGVGVFEMGGFVLDGGHSFGKGKEKFSFLPSSFSTSPPPKTIIRFNFPERWVFVCTIPDSKRIYGKEEKKIFLDKCPQNIREAERASHIILLKLLPGLVERDIECFGDGLTRLQRIGYNMKWGLQSRKAKKIFKKLIKVSYGAGLSSFGPLIYALADGRKHAIQIMEELDWNGWIAEVSNRGVSIERLAH